MTLRDIKIGVIRYYRMRGIKLTFSRYRREVGDAMHFEANGIGPMWGRTTGTPKVWKGS
jgi:hypothetical protein